MGRGSVPEAKTQSKNTSTEIGPYEYFLKLASYSLQTIHTGISEFSVQDSTLEKDCMF